MGDTQKKKLQEEGKHEEAEKLEMKRPLHVENMGKVVEERTIINSASGTKDRLVKEGEEFPIDEYFEFKDDNQRLLNEFVEADWDKSRELLLKHGDALLDECADGYFKLSSLTEEVEGNTTRAQKLVHQGQIVSQIRQLAAAMRRPPRDLVHRLFERFDADSAAFHEGVRDFYGHIQRRAVEKKKETPEQRPAQLMNADSAAAQKASPLVEIMYDLDPEMRKSLAPKGVDPVQVYEALPEPLKVAFKASSTKLLQQAEEELEPEVFKRHFQLCIDSGLWEEELNAFVHLST